MAGTPAELPARWPSPAKLNLFLRITGRRPDGYHELQTVFQFLDLGDEIAFEPAPRGRIELAENLPGVPAANHLCTRAAALLRRHAGAVGVRIRLSKRIPMGAGLGGGSSNAATTLVALNRIWGLDLPVEALAELGLGLGADVPVFVRGLAAWGEGVGERLTPVRPPEPWYVVVFPGVRVPTPEIFNATDLTRNSPPLKIPRSLSDPGVAPPSIQALLALAGNDCEAVVRRRHPEVGEALDWLSGVTEARMTGTGSAVFGPFARRVEAERAADTAPPRWWVAVARGVNESPLRRHLPGVERQ
jgi:4-diphosphocytidyl-2-C-methyl-D-erythritol kinase